MTAPLFVVDGHAITVAEALIAFASAFVLILIALIIALTRSNRSLADAAADSRARAVELDLRLADLARLQAETVGRVHTLGDVLGSRQSELARTVSERLDAVTHRLGDSVVASARNTVEGLSRLNERLAVIDEAQKNLGELAGEMTSLRAILADKQARGAFGQGRMEAIVADALPERAYAFQPTLPNGKRPDCAIYLPGDPRPLIVDAKFPLEAVLAWRAAEDDAARKAAAARVKTDVGKHVADIAERYLLPGDTLDVALMFVPSESIYAELAEGFEEVIQKAFHARVLVVSPSLLMLAIQVVQVLVRDQRMQQEARLIRGEVGHLVADVMRLKERALNLQKHFGQAAMDVEQVVVSADKIARRGARIEAMEIEDTTPASNVIAAPIERRAVARES